MLAQLLQEICAEFLLNLPHIAFRGHRGLLIPQLVDFPEKYKFQVQGKYDESNKVYFRQVSLSFPAKYFTLLDLGSGPNLKSEEEKGAVQLS